MPQSNSLPDLPLTASDLRLSRRFYIWPRHFRNQVVLLILIAVTLGVGTYIWYMGKQQSEYIFSSLKAQGEVLTSNAAFSAESLLAKEDYASLELTLKQYVNLPNVQQATVTDENGVVISRVTLEKGTTHVVYNPSPVPQHATFERHYHIHEDSNSISFWEPLELGRPIGMISLDMSLASVSQARQTLFLDSFIFGIVAAFAVILLVTLYLRQPLQAIKKASDFAARLNVQLGSSLAVETFAQEFKELSEALNATSHKLYTQEKALEEAKERLETVLSHAGDGIITVDKNDIIQSFNPAAESLFGFREKDVLGKSIHGLFNQPLTFTGIKHSFTTMHNAQLAKRFNGTTFRADVSDSEVVLGDDKLRIAIVRDMTQRIAYEKALQASEAKARKLALVASRTNNAVIITDAYGHIEWVNDGFTRLTGYTLDEVIAKNFNYILQGPNTDKRIITYMQEQFSQAKGFKVESVNYTKSQQPYWVEVEVQPILDADDELTNFIAIESNITERKQAKEELITAKELAENANQAKNEFLSRMSHELRTPLNAILGFAQLLELDELDHDQDESVNRILKAGRHLLNLINEVLDLSRVEARGLAHSIESVPIKNTIVENIELIQPLAQQFDISLVIHSSGEDLNVFGDPQRLNQIMLNLLSNAVKYNRPGGSVSISCFEAKDKIVRIEVSDTGRGIPEDKLDRLFVPFDRLGAEEIGVEGSGIGLALTQRLVNAMNGQIGVLSEVSKGTTFWLELPQAPRDSSKIAPTPQAITEQVSVDTIFSVVYIEDNLPNLELIEKVFQKFPDTRLLTAMQGQIGLDLIRDQQPDLVLLDLHLPDLSGDEVLEQLKRNPQTRNIPIIIVSADATPRSISRLMEKGAHAYLTKPIDVAELLQNLQDIRSNQKNVSSSGLLTNSAEALDILQLANKLLNDRPQHASNLSSQQQTMYQQLNQLIRSVPQLWTSEDKLGHASAEILERLAHAAEYQIDPTGEHTKRIGQLTRLTAIKLGFDENASKLFMRAAKLHDLGVFAINDTILLKPGALTQDERAIMQLHSEIGGDILSGGQSELLLIAEKIARSHHEHYDGAGYPQGLQKDEIPISSRIVAVTDVYDALTNHRPYKKAWSHTRAMNYILGQRGQHFDPKVVDAFKAVVQEQEHITFKDKRTDKKVAPL